MTKNQFTILASKMQSGDLKDAAYLVLIQKERQCDAARRYSVSKQNLHQALKRLKARQAQFDAMAEVRNQS